MERVLIQSSYVMITGGMSWGGSPTDFLNTLSDLEEFDVIQACGFSTQTDWKKLFFLVLDKAGSTVLPKLMGLDPDLDIIIRAKLKGE